MATDALLRLDSVSKHFSGGIVGLNNINLSIAEGEFLSLLGPSGCGKTTTLRVIAGFEAPTEGEIRLDGKDITPLRAFDRPVNTVFQDYALFPHMSVAENVGFGLSLRKIAASERRKRVAAALDMVGLADKINQRVQALSGGQRQRVALARAIICEPRVLLLDEPLSALDAHLREQMQVELKRLQRELGTTFVMVTHDQTEALSISDRIVVMNKAAIEQIASPSVLYDRPATAFVAGFIGTSNLLKVRLVSRDASVLRFAAGTLSLDVPSNGNTDLQPGDGATLGVRPEDILVSYERAEGSVGASVESVVFHGRSLRVHLLTEDKDSLTADIPRQAEPAAMATGEHIFVSLRPGASCPILPS
ncbi:spermidine/putrescine transport system ATP-binding protein [Pararhizobium capsulatum DSM 1112]|uniref:Spermidine/putrescine transport system ATP-binding protein n=1 Tax=Pararhizobium capsulatum DSM 1112 TaxID=1121113 RepID=A0ABU0BN37_9HYPH|nr:ABC transporter ATP-binding protein [Pararhizobium capsulatum]MDQ0319071.1 spermidine/putrescine transport system ATP-binding protein [Pararhizobium capsulatum DSM 1112]